MYRIVVVGSGVVGQATGKGFAKKGHSVRYVDINPTTIAKLRAQGLNAMTADEVDWNTVDLVMLAVSTPSVGGKIVLDYIEAAALDVGRGLATTSNYITVVVRSTVPPTSTEQRITPILEQASGKRAGVGFGVAMNPEFLRAVSNEQDFARPWITIIGTTEQHTKDMLDELYKPFGALIVHCTPTEAEMIKYVNNVYNAVKISYFNEVYAICQKLGIDGHLVGAAVARSAESMWNPLYGTRGGVPYGGACLPKDTVAFMQFVRERGWEHLMLEATIAVNEHLEETVPAVASPDKIDTMLHAVNARGGAAAPEELAAEVGKSTPVVL
ncbi:MAG TPA: UDP-glucose/GDP-mannose dehydrogenase family protein [Rhodocyclaceae bacterium]|nr:UDP-glucose/GDP-mannose dehydrogenase family protein [Rhodocyclaceae bacterium]